MRVQVTNFQIVKKVDIDGEGFIVIKGDSSSGKSSTIKAIHAALFNRFTSTQVRYGESAAVVKIKWNKNDPLLKVTRKAEGGSPLMELGDCSWSKLTRSLPKEVENYNNLGNIDVGSSTYSLNFCTQFSKPMLLEFSQKRVMEILSASRGMEDWFKVKSILQDRQSKNNGAFSEVDALINQSKAQLSQIKFILQEKSEVYEGIQETYQKLLQLYKSQEDALNLLKFLKKRVSLANKIDILLSLVEQLKVLSERSEKLEAVNSLRGFLAFKLEFERRVSKINSKLELLERLGQTIKGKEELVSSQSKVVEFERLLNSMNDYHTRIQLLDKKLAILQSIGIKKEEVEKSTQQLTNLDLLQSTISISDNLQSRISVIENIITNNLCPCCGRKLN